MPQVLEQHFSRGFLKVKTEECCCRAEPNTSVLICWRVIQLGICGGGGGGPASGVKKKIKKNKEILIHVELTCIMGYAVILYIEHIDLLQGLEQVKRQSLCFQMFP